LRTVPSVKATFFQLAADEVARLLEAGRLTRAALGEHLQPQDWQYLGKQHALTTWIPIATHARLIEVLVAIEGGGDPRQYLQCIGACAALTLRQSGVYQQFEAKSARWGSSIGRIFATFGAVAYNFTRWSYEEGPDGSQGRILMDEARDFPECLRFTSEGFITYLWQNALDRKDIGVRSERVTRDRIVFTLLELEEGAAGDGSAGV
jgi:hypothetical protein